jgi:hypothetical protein
MPQRNGESRIGWKRFQTIPFCRIAAMVAGAARFRAMGFLYLIS